MMIANKSHADPAGLYVHIPFCTKKCHYCDFLSFDHLDDVIKQKYVEDLIREIQVYKGRNIEIDTLFIGGGTPSVLSERQIIAIMNAVQATFAGSNPVEITIEANPKTLSENKLHIYREVGINRLSLGVQSMDDAMLRSLGRIHVKQDVLNNYRMARKIGFENINIDLMFGIPGQTMKIWMETLEEAIELRPEHISFYSLQLEEGTPFYNRYKKGTLDLVSNREERAMYHKAIGKLKEAGYNHYEISNCALPGRECRHNLKYWSFDEYYGVGLGAHSFRHEYGRLCNVEDLKEYAIETADNNLPIDLDKFRIGTLQDAMGEYVFTGLRKMEGVNTELFYKMFQKDFYVVYGQNVEKIVQYQSQGYLRVEGNNLALTEKGVDISNEIMAEFV